MRVLVLICSMLSFNASYAAASAQTLSCRDVFSYEPPKAPLPEKLLELRELEVARLSEREVAWRNEQDIVKLQKEIPWAHVNRAHSISMRDAHGLLNSIDKHPVLNSKAKLQYNREDVEVGYCFGRAAYYHLLALRMGLQKESIRKIWIVAPIKNSASSEVVWDHHVVTAVFTPEKGWVTLDPYVHKPEPVHHWVQTYASRAIDGKARIYITDPSKMSVDVGSYDRLQMGLDLKREKDWFRGYFQDLMTSTPRVPLADLGLRELPRMQEADVRSARDTSTEKAHQAMQTPEERSQSIFGFLWKFFD